MTHVHKTIIVTWRFWFGFNFLTVLQSCLEIKETKQKCMACHRFACAHGFFPSISSLLIPMYFIKNGYTLKWPIRCTCTLAQFTILIHVRSLSFSYSVIKLIQWIIKCTEWNFWEKCNSVLKILRTRRKKSRITCT